VQGQLKRVEKGLAEATRSDVPYIQEAAGHIISAGGKRFRPALVILTSLLGKPDEKLAVDAALVVELTHVASLYHDDVMDEATTRRGVESSNLKYGNSVAILVGDYLFARASTFVGTLGADYIDLQARTFMRLVTGQIMEGRMPAEPGAALQHYLKVVADKTGSLIATSARFGGMVAGLPGTQLDALSAFGEEIGMVFQLSDDIMDIESDRSGKAAGTDLREGVLTLPTLLVLESQNPADDELKSLLRRPLEDEAEVARALELLRAHPAMDKAKAEVSRRLLKAKGHLQVLPSGKVRDALGQLADGVANRQA
jgi:heptaprenyl diphosphate synthase